MRGLQGRKRTVLLALDETILPAPPPLRIAWGKGGQQISIPITGNRGKRILDGALNLRSGQRELSSSLHWAQDDFQAFLRQIRRRWRGWRSVVFLDRGSPHTAQRSRELARALGIELRWLPTACPELNPVDHLWRHLTRDVLGNCGLQKVTPALDRALVYLQNVSPEERRRKAG
jgi:transposase